MDFISANFQATVRKERILGTIYLNPGKKYSPMPAVDIKVFEGNLSCYYVNLGIFLTIILIDF